MTESRTNPPGTMDRLLLDRHFRLTRVWSNGVLRTISPFMAGEVVNVSAWMDDDKEGGKYRDYFPNAATYHTTNYGGYRGDGGESSIPLDLEAPLPLDLGERFDVVFNHTTLEHIFDVFLAVKNLCLMSRDLVIVVVPAVQCEHRSESFSDYWRFTSDGLAALFRKNGMEVVSLVSSPYRNAAIYHFLVASKRPQHWRKVLPSLPYGVNEGKDLIWDPWFLRVLRRMTKLRAYADPTS